MTEALMQPGDDELERLRADLYRPDADGSTLLRYCRALAAASGSADAAAAQPATGRSARDGRAVLAVLATALLIPALSVGVLLPVAGGPAPPPLLERGTSSAPAVLRWSSLRAIAAVQRDAVRRSLHDPRRAEQVLLRYPELVPLHGRLLSAQATGDAGPLLLDAFGPLVEASSEIVVVLRCGSTSGRYRLRLSTAVQRDASIVPAALRTIDGGCDRGAQAVRYRPLRGVLPTTALLDAPAGSAMAVLLTR